MSRFVLTGSAALLAATLAVSTPALAQDGQSRDRGGDQALDQARQRDRAEEQAQGGRQVQVKEKDLWGLGELPPRLMHKAMEKLSSEPDEARKAVMQAANILSLQAAMGQNSEPARRLEQQAEQLNEVARRIEYRQLLTRDELKQPFGQAAVAAAAFYQSAAEQGLQKRDAEQTGYTLKGAAEYLSAAHTFGERQPQPQVSRALFDADRLSAQIIKLSKPTTEQDQQRGKGGGSAQQTAQRDGQGDLDRDAQVAGARDGGQQGQAGQIPDQAQQVIRDLGQAIQQASAAGGGQPQQPQQQQRDASR